MSQAPIDLLNRWMTYCRFDPEETKFNLLSKSYDIHKVNKAALRIVESYDESGIMALIYVKGALSQVFNHIYYHVITMLQEWDSLSELHEIWTAFNSPEVRAHEDTYVQMFSQLTSQMSDVPLLGDDNEAEVRQALFAGIDNVVEGLDKLHLDIYQRGGPVHNPQNFSTYIHVFDMLADCLLALTQAPDGMYLCYINNNYSADGYFGYFIKSNGNLFSLHERVDEIYEGQHECSRSARWTENKQYAMFPYKYIFEYTEHDHKGYATKHIINKDKLSFSNFGQDECSTILLSMMLLVRRYDGKPLPSEAPLKLVNSLLRPNLISLQETALIKFQENSLVKAHSGFRLGFDKDKVLSGEYNKEFDFDRDKSYHYGEYGSFPDFGQIFVDCYGDGFEFTEDELLTSGRTMLLSNGDTDTSPPNELIGTAQRLRAHAYYQLRRQLAQYIKYRQDADFEAFGGREALVRWFRTKVYGKRNELFQLCANAFRNDEDQMTIEIDKGIHSAQPFKYAQIEHTDSLKGRYWHSRAIWLNNTEACAKEIYCPYFGVKCSHFFIFKPYSWESIEKLLGCEVPKFMKGWYSDTWGYPYNGNSLLDLTDAVADIETPLNRRRSSMGDSTRFEVYVGFSKRGLSKLLMEYPDGNEV